MPSASALIADWGTAVVTSATAALALFLGAIPKVIGSLATLIIRWLISIVQSQSRKTET